MVRDAFVTVQCLEFFMSQRIYNWACSHIKMEKEKKNSIVDGRWKEVVACHWVSVPVTLDHVHSTSQAYM